MGLFKNLRLLTAYNLVERMVELERRQELLEDFTDQKLDSMKRYSARVGKRDRDELARGSRTHELEAANAGGPNVSTGNVSPRVARLMARRARRGLSRGPDLAGA